MTPRHEIVVRLTLDTTEVVAMLQRVADALDLTVPEDAEDDGLCRCAACIGDGAA